MKNTSDELFSTGMVHIKGLLDVDAVALLRSELMALYNNSRTLPRGIKTKAEKNSVSEIREISGLSASLTAFSESPVYKQCSALANEIFSTDCRYGHDEAIFKSPGSEPVDWHQDQFYSKYDKDKQCVSMWIPMQATSPANGGMEYVINTEESLREHKRLTSDSFMYRIPEDKITDEQKVSPVMELGDICVHTPLCVHRSHPNTSNELRVAWILQFNKYGARRFLRWNNLKHYFSGRK